MQRGFAVKGMEVTLRSKIQLFNTTRIRRKASKQSALPLLVLGFLSLGAQAAGTTRNTNDSPAPQQSLATGAEAKKPDFSPHVKFDLYGRGITDDNERTRVAGVDAKGGFSYRYDEFLVANVDALAVGETGSTHSLFDQNQARNGIFLDQATAEIKPLGFLALEAGAINQRFLNNPLLMDDSPFPALREKIWILQNKVWQLGLQAEQAIPTSVSMSTMTSEKEPLPLFQTQSITAEYQGEDFRAAFSGGHFQFRDLPAQVALGSVNFGNSVDATVPQNARYKYRYEGWEGGAFAENRLNDWIVPRIGGNYLVNTAAPGPGNNGYLAFLQTELQVSRSWNLIPRYEWFVNERNSSPAYYNAAAYGHNNRQGYLAEIRVGNLSRGIAFKGQYVDSRILEKDPLQVNSKFFFIGMELSRVSF